MVLLQPVDDETVRSQKPQHRSLFYGLEGPDPRIELLLGQLPLQDANALVPKRRFCSQEIPRAGTERAEKRYYDERPGSLYRMLWSRQMRLSTGPAGVKLQ